MTLRRSDETHIHIAIVEYLRLVLPGALVWHTPNSGKRSKREAAEFQRMGVLAGVPDILVLPSCAGLLCIEVKAKKGTLSKGQRDFRDFCAAARIPWALVRSVEDTRAFLAAHSVETREAA